MNQFLHSEVNLLIQHIIVQDQDGQNNIRGSFFFQPPIGHKKTPMNIKNLFYYQKKGNFLHYFST